MKKALFALFVVAIAMMIVTITSSAQDSLDVAYHNSTGYIVHQRMPFNRETQEFLMNHGNSYVASSIKKELDDREAVTTTNAFHKAAQDSSRQISKLAKKGYDKIYPIDLDESTTFASALRALGYDWKFIDFASKGTSLKRDQLVLVAWMINQARSGGQQDDNAWQKADQVLRNDMFRVLDNHEGRLKNTVSAADLDTVRIGIGEALNRTDKLRSDLETMGETVASLQTAVNNNTDVQAVVQALVYHADWKKSNSPKDQAKWQGAIDEARNQYSPPADSTQGQ